MDIQEDGPSLTSQIKDLSKALDTAFEEARKLHRLPTDASHGQLFSHFMDDLLTILHFNFGCHRVTLAKVTSDQSLLEVVWGWNDAPMSLLADDYQEELPPGGHKGLLDPTKPTVIGDLIEYLEEVPDARLVRLICTEGHKSLLVQPLPALGKVSHYLILASHGSYALRPITAEATKSCAKLLGKALSRCLAYQQIADLLAHEHQAKLRSDRTAPRHPPKHGPKPKAVVLYADKSELSQLTAELVLTANGYHPLTCADGRELVNRFEDFNPDLIIATPDALVIDGQSLEDVLRADCPIWLIPFVYVVPSHLRDAVDQGEDTLGTDVLIAKPLDPAELIAKTEDALDAGRRVEQAAEQEISEVLGRSPELPIIAQRYTTQSLITRDDYCSIYVAKDSEITSDRPVILKYCEVNPHRPFSLMRAARLMIEAEHLRLVEHPGIPAFLYMDTTADGLYLAMEYVDGVDLRTQVKAEGPLAGDNLLVVAVSISWTLNHLTKKGIVHGAIKPTSIIFTLSGGMKLVGFGNSSRIESACKSPEFIQDNCLYMPPEMSTHAPAQAPPADIYSLGVCLYFAASGQYPYDDDSAEEILRLHRESSIPLLDQLAPDLGEDACTLISDMLNRNPADRPTAEQVQKRASALLQQSDPDWEFSQD